MCPSCKLRTSQAVRPETVARNLQLWCRHCKATYIVDIESGQCFLSQCPT
ncbi:cysteine-rich KTR domain-containing protein [Flavonifractor sp. An92]|nr:cysteine-rich KTR domain-containing protein [Flavonifractor sp. An92]